MNNLKKIKKEYSLRLIQIDQKKDYQSFINLKQEYNQYLSLYLDNIEDNKLSDWIKRIKIIYKDFISRNDLNIWKQILQDDVCNCEKKNDARDLLILLLMEESYISQDVLSLINKKFGLIENKNDLYKKFPTQFIKNLINHINKKEYPLYEFFDIKDGLPYDEFLDLFYKFDYNVKNDELKEAKVLLKQIESLDIQHPQLDVNKYIYYFKKHNIFKFKKIFRELEDKYNSLNDVKILVAHSFMNSKKYKSASDIFEKIITTDSKNNLAIEGLCSCYIMQEKMLEAKNYMDYLLDTGYVTKDDERFYIINDSLMKKLKKTIKNNDDDYLRLVDINIEIQNYEKALEMLNSRQINNENKVIYYALLTKLYIKKDEYLKALNNTKICEGLIKNLTKKQKIDLKSKFGYKIGNLIEKENIYLQLALIYFRLGYKDMYSENIGILLKSNLSDIQYIIEFIKLLDTVEEFELIIQICDDLLEENIISINFYKIKALYRLGRFVEAYDICDLLLKETKYYVDIYIYKIRILIEWNEIDKSKKIINYLKSEGIKVYDFMYFEALILKKQNKINESKKIVNKLKKINPKDINFIFKNEFIKDGI